MSLVNETNPLNDPSYHYDRNPVATLDLTDPRLVEVTRLRYIGDIGEGLNLSYAHGVDVDGNDVDVRMPDALRFLRCWTHGRAAAAIVTECERLGIYAKGKGLLDALSVLA